MEGPAASSGFVAPAPRMADRVRIAEELVGGPLVDGLYATCPGAAMHSTKSAKRDFWVKLEGAPTGYCLHNSCAAAVEAFNDELRRRIRAVERGWEVKPMPWKMDGVAPRPEARIAKRPPYDAAKLKALVGDAEPVSREWLKKKSPVPVELVGPVEFLEQVFELGERVMVFTAFYSQGDYLHEVGRGSFRLSERRGVKAVRSALPGGGKEGMWFLSNPVTGLWVPNPSDPEKWTRRSWQNVTAWRYAVLESDEAPEDLWLRLLVRLEIPIVAIYSSGGKSVHALVRVAAGSKLEWDESGVVLRQSLGPLGADCAALTAVRLTRLPGCMRGDRKQELIYLNPQAVSGRSIR